MATNKKTPSKSNSTKNGGTSRGSEKKSTTKNSGTGKGKSSGSSTRSGSIKEKQPVKLTPEEQEALIREKGVMREIKDEAILIGTAVFAILLFLSNFKMSGKVGEVVSGVMFGLFGFLAYLMPAFLVIVVAFFLANRRSKQKLYVSKIVASVIIFILVASMIQLAVGDTRPDTKLTEYYKYAKEFKSGGGFIGGVLCRMFVPLFGLVGSYVVMAALEIVCLMIITGKAFIQLIRDYLKERSEINAERRKEYDKMAEEYADEHAEDIVPKKKAHTFLLKDKPEEEEEEKPKEKNFFGGYTPTKPVGIKDENPGEDDGDDGDVSVDIIPGMGKAAIIKRANEGTEPEEGTSEPFAEAGIGTGETPIEELPQEDKELVLTGKYTPFEETKSAIESIYEESKKKKFEGKPEIKGTGSFNNSGAPEIKEKREPSEMSFSDSALRDRAYAENSTPDTIFDEVPYAMKKVNERLGKTTEDKITSGGSKGEKIITPDKVIEGRNKQLEFVPEKVYKFPPMNLLEAPASPQGKRNDTELANTAKKLQQTLQSFGVNVTITDISRGPSVTRYELQPEVGVKVSKITALADDIKLNLAAADIRIEAPIPGKAAVGIEVPNTENTMVTLYELIDSKEFRESKGAIPFTVGKSIEGNNIIGDIAKMPHVLIAGATGSGKSVCINTIIMSILYKEKPDDLKLIMIDPKVVELSVYNGIPHLLIPVVTDPKKAASALNWACNEMDARYQKFAELSVRDLKGYNERVKAEEAKGNVDPNYPYMPKIVIIVDELADLMMVASGDVEGAICRLAQKARACGMHLIIATQRPSVNVITGLIKANIPSRVAFAVTSGTDSRTILDSVGAEKLLGKGDMLYFPTGLPKPVRIQGAFVSDSEVNNVVEFLKNENETSAYNADITEKIEKGAKEAGNGEDAKGGAADTEANDGRDELFAEAGRFIIEKQKASIGFLQRALKIGFNRAARIMDQLAEVGVVSEEDGTKPRTILMSMSDFENILNKQG
ncbi:MAG: DNA translocase FtsK [Lachnospiraceae bacterium]|nr:DNA translocase FtsK [Lachnospiraceae bacterium]